MQFHTTTNNISTKTLSPGQWQDRLAERVGTIMLTMKEVGEANTLFRKYVSTSRKFNLLELYGSVRRECGLAEKGAIKVSRDLLRELRADRAKIGYLARKVLSQEELKNPWAPFATYQEWLLSPDYFSAN